MSKTYTINGVQVSYDEWNSVMNPDVFTPSNVDAPDIPQQYKDAYATDTHNERMGRGRTLWTPRRRMLKSLAWKDEQVKKKKEARLKQREAKMEAWGEQRTYEQGLASESARRQKFFTEQAQKKEREDEKSAIFCLSVFLAGLAITAPACWALYYICKP